MIQIESIYIQEFRGIKELTLDMHKRNFAICGPNGTGKSGIIDAIEFALTGTISGLTGVGLGNVSVKEHGPHVDNRNNPSNSLVTLSIFIPSLNKSAKIQRTVKDLNTPQISPPDADVLSVLNNLSMHPEFALTRRELMKYVLSTPGKRSEEIQSLLRLDKLEAVRSSLSKIANSHEKAIKHLEMARTVTHKELLEALDITTLSSAAILGAANTHRTTLGLPIIEVLEKNTSLKDGISSITPAKSTSKIPKHQAIADLNNAKNCLGSVVKLFLPTMQCI